MSTTQENSCIFFTLSLIANEIFGRESHLRFIDGYYSKKSEKEIIPWHVDQAYQGDEKKSKNFVNPDHYFLKFFIYLTDVKSENGCTSYIPKSHKIAYALRKGIFENKIELPSVIKSEVFDRKWPAIVADFCVGVCQIKLPFPALIAVMSPIELEK